MFIAQKILAAAPAGVTAELVDGGARALIGPARSGDLVPFSVVELPTLSTEAIDTELPAANDAPLLVVFRRASPEARERLRENGIAYAGADGRWFVSLPGLHIDRDDRTRAPEDRLAAIRAQINPFGIRTSRVPRWLLLHPDRAFGITELAREVELSAASVSRAIAALEDEALVEEADDGRYRNAKVVHVRQPRQLLDAWLAASQRRRVERRWWDIGSMEVAETLNLLRSVVESDVPASWALGGLVGAAGLGQRVAEPRDVLVWTSREDVGALAEALMPVETRSPYNASMRVAIASDPFVLRLAREYDGLPIADPVQLWLDCMSEGERAVEAAAALAKGQGW